MNLSCIDCGNEDTQEHLLNCSIHDNDKTDMKFSDIFGTLEQQTNIIKELTKINFKRTSISLKPSLWKPCAP